MGRPQNGRHEKKAFELTLAGSIGSQPAKAEEKGRTGRAKGCGHDGSWLITLRCFCVTLSVVVRGTLSKIMKTLKFNGQKRLWRIKMTYSYLYVNTYINIKGLNSDSTEVRQEA